MIGVFKIRITPKEEKKQQNQPNLVYILGALSKCIAAATETGYYCKKILSMSICPWASKFHPVTRTVWKDTQKGVWWGLCVLLKKGFWDAESSSKPGSEYFAGLAIR